MSTINFRSLKKVVAGTTVAIAVAAALTFAHNDESIARGVSAPRAVASQNANLGDALPVSLGGGIAPILW